MKQSVVPAANYVVRRYGIHNAMPSANRQKGNGILVAAVMLTIDGPQGEGGGQVLHSSLVTVRPLVIENICASRKKPGLLQ